MSECGPSFDFTIVDGCTGEPIPGAIMEWIGLGPFPAYPGGPINPCAIQTNYTAVASSEVGHEGEVTADGVWMNSGGLSHFRVRAYFSTSGQPDFRYAENYVDASQVTRLDFAVWPANGICPPAGPGDDTPSGDCTDCGQVEVITGAVSTLPSGYNKPDGWKGLGFEDGAERCTTSTSRLTMFTGACFPGCDFVEGWDLASVFGADGSLPMDWNEPAGVSANGAATAAMVHLLMQNQRFLSMQLSYCMTMLERLGVFSNQFNQALNTRLLFIQEEIQLLGVNLNGEGWCDRTVATREDPYSSVHPEIP